VVRAEALLVAGKASAALDAASRAVAVASRQFLPGVGGIWVERRQADMRELHLRALEDVARAATAGSQWADAVAAAESAIALESYRESAYRRLVAAHAASGNRAEALRAYERCRRALSEELGVGPSASTEALYLSLLGDASPVDEAALPLPATLAGVPGTVLAGRHAEVANLIGALRRAREAGRQVFLVAGEPGMGKTELVSHAARLAWADGARVLYGRCDEDLGLPYQPVAEALEGYVAGCPIVELHTHVAAHGGDLSRLVPALARRVPDAAAPAVADPEADRHRLFQAVAALLTAASKTRPVVLVLDDLHWADSETLLLVRHLVRACRPAALLIVGTYRHTEVGVSHPLSATLADLWREAAVERLVLDGLDAAAVAEIVAGIDAAMAGEERMSLARAVTTHTNGNPFFAGELIRHVVETGSSYRRVGTWSYYENRTDVDVPQGVRDVVSRRLLRLSEVANRALVLASVVGNEFTLDLLERVVGPDAADELLDAVDEAVGGHLVVEVGQGRYRFRHDLLRDTIQSGISTTRRCRIHGQIGEALEASPTGPTGPPFAALAFHFAETASAACAAKAADYAAAAARQAIALAAWDDAATRLERGLEVLDLQEPPDLERRCDLLLLVAETWMRCYDPVRARAAATRAVDSARRLGSPVRLGQAAYWVLRAGEGSMSGAAAALIDEALTALGDSEPGLRAKLLARSGVCRGMKGGATIADALALARRSQDTDALGVALSAAAGALRGSPALDAYLCLAEELVADAPPGGWDGWRSGHSLRGHGRLAVGDRLGFEIDQVACARIGTEGRYWFFSRQAAMWEATLALLDGRFAEVESLAAAARDLARLPGDDLYLRQLFRLRVDLGEPEAAFDLASRMDPGNEIHRSMLTFALAERDGVEAHRTRMEAFVAEPLDHSRPERVPVTLAYRAEVALSLGTAEAATALYDHLLPYRGQVVVGGMGEGCMGAADRYLGMLAGAAGRKVQAEAHFQAALALETGMSATALVVRTNHWYGRMLVRHGHGDAARGRELLGASLTAAEALGMTGLARATRPLVGTTYTASTAGR